ncbi:serine/threonine-protein kinase [Nannocystis sp.]|uniref:serine/threonine-protein kinase n=1 Tax=Nannocystis sp. TaxID=1962667 RepID=UPI0025CCB2AB|nr:serine/threonine-protein kinase [Nannocystis sp.]MBK7828672.1 serine/threonine protein kinase [Nannocystis sp.]
MTSEHDSLDTTLSASQARPRPWLVATQSVDRQHVGPPADPAGPLDKQLVKRALFPQRAIPVRIGRFTVLGLVGRGGMGVVYACHDELLGRKVAVKVLHSEVRSDHASRRLQREAQALAKLSHPNVVAVHDVGTLGERVYLAMEFVDGQTLGAWLAATRPGWREVLRVILAVGDGLAAAHDKGLIHRDIKPDNIMVGADGRVRLMDFGLAHADNETTGDRPAVSPGALHSNDAWTAELTRTGSMMGTPAYMASEQFLGEPVDARSDQFSLCATAWLALYGQPPFAGETLLPLASNVTSGALTPPPAGTRVPTWLRRVLERGLRPRAEDRHVDTRALLAALRADPTRRRWFAGLAAGTTAAVLLGFGVAAAVEQRAIAACAAEGAAIDDDWNDATRAALERSFLATGKAYAATTYARTLPWFDRWAAAWATAATRSCHNHTLAGTWDADLRLRAHDCLAEARGNFTALVHELGDADDGALVRATAAAAGLASVDACTRPEALRQRPMMQPGQRDAVVAVRARLAHAASLEAAGRYDDGLAVASAALGPARASGWAPVLAQAELRAASLAERTGDYAEAEASLLRALAAAGEARSPALALSAATDLLYLVGYRSSRPAEGRVWARSVQLQLALLPGEHPLERADLANHLAGVEYVSGDYPAAVRLYTDALALREAALGRDHPRVGDSLNNLAGALYAQGDNAEATRLYLRALALTEQALGPDHPQVATTLSNLSLVYQSTGAYADALRVLTRTVAIREAALGPDHPQMANALSNLALVHEAMGANDEAARLFLRALEILERSHGPEHPQVADCLHNLATVRFATGDHNDAIRLLGRALAIYAKLQADDHPMMATSLAALAQIHLARHEHAEALRLYTRALTILEASLGADHPSAAHVLTGLGETHAAMGHTHEAVALLERALAIRVAGSVQREELAETRFALARALGPEQARRARELALEALHDYAETVGSERERLAVEAWLAAARAAP